MLFEFTPGLQRALMRAMAWAQQEGCAEAAPLHLLLGLLEDDEAQASVLLVAAGSSRDQLVAAFFAAPLPADAEDALPFAEATRDVLTRARELARTLATEASITTEHVLLALLERESDLRSRLETLGLDFTRLRESIQPTREALFVGEPLDLLEPPEEIDVARILDACANRGREALRVLEDHCRFVAGDALLSRELKELRHELASLMKNFPERLLLESRDTLGDVGTQLSTPQERERSSLEEVLRANAARLQEALRSLEEFSKVYSPQLGQAFEQLRYRTYTIERAVVLAGAARDRLADARLYALVTEDLCRASLFGTVAELIAGGVQIIQLREKKRADRDLLAVAHEVRKMTRQAGVLFIVNDRPDIARLVEADGVHLGQDDMLPRDARRMIGPRALVGVSTHDLEQVRRAVLQGASYLGVGPTFPSRTKDFAGYPGLDFVRQVVAETSLPAFVLGGVTLDNLPEVLAAGGSRVAVSHGLCAAEDPRITASRMRRLLDGSAG